jgi:hypothetical protein
MMLRLLKATGMLFLSITLAGCTARDPAVVMIEQLGGKTITAQDDTGKPFIKLVVFGPDGTLTDTDLSVIAGQTRMERLDINRYRVTDDGLVYVEELIGLKALCISKTPITDAGLVHLTPLKQLTSLELIETQITDSGLKCLRAYPKTPACFKAM